eukprot:1920440-Amphidinium_carterae.1
MAGDLDRAGLVPQHLITDHCQRRMDHLQEQYLQQVGAIERDEARKYVERVREVLRADHKRKGEGSLVPSATLPCPESDQ